ncbi:MULTISPECIES: hypothetical protein [unclassified Roseofilum]|nr:MULTISPECIES: hypothetical protein [unclassified Roseofilum]
MHGSEWEGWMVTSISTPNLPAVLQSLQPLLPPPPENQSNN